MEDWIEGMENLLKKLKQSRHFADIVHEHGNEEDVEFLRDLLEKASNNSLYKIIIKQAIRYIENNENLNKNELLEILKCEE